ncbi:MAG: hypothetical protein J3Q66DRAFT_339950, partial [Benniella sp.]
MLRVLPLTNDPLQPMTDLKDLSDLLKVHGRGIETVGLGEKELEEPTDRFCESDRRGSIKVERPRLEERKRSLGGHCIKSLASIVAQSELRTLDIHLEDEMERVHILELIQWEHIRELAIRMDDESLGMSPLKALVNGIKNFFSEESTWSTWKYNTRPLVA